jgi:hypothetical protein
MEKSSHGALLTHLIFCRILLLAKLHREPGDKWSVEMEFRDVSFSRKETDRERDRGKRKIFCTGQNVMMPVIYFKIH